MANSTNLRMSFIVCRDTLRSAVGLAAVELYRQAKPARIDSAEAGARGILDLRFEI